MSVGGAGGQGGRSNGAVGTGNNHSTDLDLQTIFDPPANLAADGEDVHISGADSGQGEDSQVGTFEGQGQENEALVPYLQVLAEYLDRATQAIERPGFPATLRPIVRSYFDLLGGVQE